MINTRAGLCNTHVERWVTGINFSQIICIEETAWKKYWRKHGSVHMIPASNAIGTNAQGFVILDQLQLPILKAFAQYALLLHATLKVCCFRFACSRITCPSHCSSHPSSKQPPHRGRHAQSPAVVYGLWSVLNQRMASYREISWHPKAVVY